MARKPIIYLALIYLVLSCTKDVEELPLDISKSPVEIIDQQEHNTSESHSEDYLAVYEWVVNMQLSNGLMESSEDTDFVSLYDNALSALAFLSAGEDDKAEKIFDYFNQRIETELWSGTGGFYQFRNGKGQNRRTRWLGDNAWLLIALNNYKAITGKEKYDNLKHELETWIRSLQDTDGGLWGGFREDGSQFHKITEGNLVAYAAVDGYDEFHKGILNFLETQRWDSTDSMLVAWPENPHYYYALDLLPLGFLIFEDFPIKTFDNADRFFTYKVSTLSTKEAGGYCFDEDKDVIWLEGTAQMGLAFQYAGQYSKQQNLLLNLQILAKIEGSGENEYGLPYVSNPGSCYGAVALWDHADKKAALSSSIWYLFNEMEFNPLATGQKKNIPEADKFWVE